MKKIAKSGDPGRLLDRILDTPHLASIVPQLKPEVLHQIVQRVGVEDCGELLALATPDQLVGLIDLDLWSAAHPGLDEQFDAARFGIWLEALVESDSSIAAQVLTRMDPNLLIGALARHIRVFDAAAIAPIAADDEYDGLARSTGPTQECEIGGYAIVASRPGSWDAIVASLMALEEQHRQYFHDVMRGCRRLSNSRPEADGFHDLLDAREQIAFDLAFDRERRREKQGYVTPAQARAFLQLARQGHVTSSTPPDNPLPRAYFRAVETQTPASNGGTPNLLVPANTPAPAEDAADAVAALVEVLQDTGVLPRQPRALLDGPRETSTSRFTRMERHLQFLRDTNDAAYSTRSEELAYLANALLGGCSIQARSLTAQEASDAAIAICNLGLQNWPAHWISSELRREIDVDDEANLPVDFLARFDLVSVFQVGWTVLHDRVCMHAAEQLIRTLTDLRCSDRETQAGLNQLRMELTKQWRRGEPWRARNSLEVIAILDLPAWAALLGLIDQLPVMHAALVASSKARLRSISASQFEFISDNHQIASIVKFLRLLPETLAG